MSESSPHKLNRTITRDTLRLRHHFRVRKRQDHSARFFMLRTVAAQIHAWAALASLVSVCFLAAMTWARGPWHTAYACIFGLSAILLFSASAIMHFLSQGFRISKRLERVLENTDKYCIHLLIAGTYTAVMDIALKEPLKTNMLLAVWIFAGAGIFYTCFFDYFPRWMQSRILYTGQFLVMGWLVLFCIRPLMEGLSTSQLVWSFAGGAFYSVGAIIYAFERPNFFKFFGYHELWHFLVVAGCFSFFTVVFLAYL